MTFGITPGAGIEVAGSLLVVVLGLLVARVRPWTRRQGALIVYALGLGAGTALSNFEFAQGGTPQTLLWSGVHALLATAAAAVAVLGATFIPAGEPRARTLARVTPILLALAVLAMWTLPRMDEVRTGFVAAGILWSPATSTGVLSLPTLLLFSLASAVVVAANARTGSLTEVREAALISTALAIYPTFYGVALSVVPGVFGWLGIALFPATIWLSITWLVTASRCADPATARNAALIPLVSALAGLLIVAAHIRGAAGTSRILTVAVLAYAILRHRALGIDAKLRFGISKGTIAGAFVAVFFVTSEAAQQFFGEIADSQYIGIAAAGTLVFALAPLQRLADRLAEKAVPTPRQTPVGGDTRAEATYRAALRAAARDGIITRREEMHLVEVAENLGISHRRAVEIRAAVEDEERP